MTNTDVLIFVEDPGVANFVADLPAVLGERGWRTDLLVAGTANNYLGQRGVTVHPLQKQTRAQTILDNANPHLLLVGTSDNIDTLGLDLLAHARASNIESVGVVDALQNARHRFAGRTDDPLAYAPDWLLVTDADTMQAYAELGFPCHRIIVSGHPHYDYVRDFGTNLAKQDRNAFRERLFPAIRPGDVAVVFAFEGTTGLNPQQYERTTAYTLAGRGSSTRRTEIVLEEFLDAIGGIDPRPYLVLRLHPKDPLGDVGRYFNEFDLISKDGSSLELLHAADFIVGMTSMALPEAAILGRSTLSIVPRLVEKEWCPSVRNGLTPCVTTRPQLRSTLNHMFQQGFEGPGDQDTGRWVFDSLGRTTDFLECLLDGSQRSESSRTNPDGEDLAADHD